MISVLTSEPIQVLVLINVILTLSLLFPFVTGVWSMGLPGMMCAGAYAASYLSVAMHTPIYIAIAVGGVAGGLISLPFASLALRIQGINLAIATLAASGLLLLFFSHFEPTGSVSGYMGMEFLPVLPIAIIAASIAAVCVWIYCSRLGKAMIAAGVDPLVAECNGVNVRALQLLALALGGVLAGVAGGLYAHYYTFISPANFGFDRLISVLMFLVIGGLTPLGAIAGAVTLSLLPQFVTGFEAWAPAIYAVLLIVVVALLPDGVFRKNRLQELRSIFARSQRSQSAPPIAAKAGASK